ncbi:MAG: TonB-dependent receptor plug domain-containing protein [Pyrinomonadaceae bacterium]
MKFVLLIVVLLAALHAAASAQNVLRATVRSELTREPIAGAAATAKEAGITAAADAAGRVELAGLPDGEATIEFFSPGFEVKEIKLTFPLADPRQAEMEILLKVTNDAGEVTVSTTRTGREIEAEPTRVEAIDEEEIDEKSSMRSSNVSMILNESTGIKVQQTSATAYTQSIRIQGLDGRYTQILKDGFPAYGGFSGSLSLLDILPLDLKQVEIIKGPAATYYGGGAIAGVVNFISKEPETGRATTSMIFNQTSALGTDLSAFHTRRLGRVGYSVLGSLNFQKEYDVDDDDLTELPRTRSFAIDPRLFLYPDEKTRFSIGSSTTVQSRRGGDIFVIRGRGDDHHRYFEYNDSLRNVTTVRFDRDLARGRRFVAKQSLAFFRRSIDVPGYRFEGDQLGSYTDVSFFQPVKRHALVLGFNAAVDRFKDRSPASNALGRRDESRTTFGGYVQDTFDLTGKLAVEAGFRLDAVRDFGVFALPRVSLLYRLNEKLTSRLGFGLGYKAPTMFTEDAETLLFRNVLPVGRDVKAERSRGATFDINYRDRVGEAFEFSINQMFFYTEITDPLVLVRPDGGAYRPATAANSSVISRGIETNVRASYDLFKLFAGYTYTYAEAGYRSPNQFLPLTPKSRINSALLAEREDDFKAGVEAYFTSSQFLDDGSRTPSYWVVGLFGEKIFGKFSLFFNAENVTDTRQSRLGRVVTGPHREPSFAQIFTHTEGRVFNGGIKIRL